MKIVSLMGREIYNSRGWPTLQCELVLEDGHSVFANVPSGLSTGSYEAHMLFDGEDRFWGRGLQNAINTVENVIAPELVGKEPHAVNMDLRLLELDGTPDKSHLGVHPILAVSMALYRAHAYIEDVDLFEFIGYVCGAETVALPLPFFNVINGGMHADNNLQIQEMMILPVGLPDFRSSMEVGALIFHELGSVLKRYKKPMIFGDEGGYAPQFSSDFEALDILSETLERVFVTYGFKALIALDVAASTFYDTASQSYLWDGKQILAEELVGIYEKLAEQYPICSIEDGLAENDWNGWTYMAKHLKDKVQVVADDLTVTNVTRIAHAIETSAMNGVIIKPNQIGTITETLQAIRLCHENNIMTIVSHRSGDTADSFIADMAVGASAGQFKSGGLCHSERLAKYNRLLVIEDHLTAGV